MPNISKCKFIEFKFENNIKYKIVCMQFRSKLGKLNLIDLKNISPTLISVF